jgi:hypothetical protein
MKFKILTVTFQLLFFFFFPFSVALAFTYECNSAGSKPTLVDSWVDHGTGCGVCAPYAGAPALPGGGIGSISGTPGVTYDLCCCTAPKLVASSAVATALGLIATDPQNLVADIVSLVLGIVGGVVLLLLISGAFKYATSQGSPDAIMDAKHTITAALTGLAVIVFAVLILGTLGVNVFGLPGFSWSGRNLITPN